MTPDFTVEPDGIVRIHLGSNWFGLEAALEDAIGTRPPKGDPSDPPSTFWLDRVLGRMEGSDGSKVELSSGNMSRLVLEGTTVTASADYDSFEDVSVDAVVFLKLLEAWRCAVIDAGDTREAAAPQD